MLHNVSYPDPGFLAGLYTSSDQDKVGTIFIPYTAPSMESIRRCVCVCEVEQHVLDCVCVGGVYSPSVQLSHNT